MASHGVLEDFHPVIRGWFEREYGSPSPPQVLGWPSIAAGRNTLILAPTGSGKTLAAFLYAINHLLEQRLAEPLPPGVRILYVSPLKALNNDIERNLEVPLRGIREEARRCGLSLEGITTAVRTGDTPQTRRAAMLRRPPDILITTPESLYLMLTAKRARPMFRSVQYLIVDEIHALCANKRGVHLSVSLERLQAIAEQEFVRIGLSATQRPLEEVAAFLGGYVWRGLGSQAQLVPRPVSIIDAGRKKSMDLRVESAVPDFSTLTADGVWPAVFAQLLELIRSHATTLVFVNNRRLAERVAAKLNEMVLGDDNERTAAGRSFNLYAVPVRTGPTPDVVTEIDRPNLIQAYHGSMSRERRRQMEEDLKAGRLRALITTSALELGIDIGSVDLVVQLQSPRGIARGLQRVGRSGHLMRATSKGRIFPTFREDLVEAAVVARGMIDHDVESITVPRNCLDVLAQQIVAMVSVEDQDVDALFDLLRQAHSYHTLPRSHYLHVLGMLAGRYSDEAFRELKARISWDRVNGVLRALPGSAHLAIAHAGTIGDRGMFGVYLRDGTTRVGEVDEEFVYESRTGDTFILGSSVWRIVEMSADRLLVEPAPGHAARMPFWRGEGIGRSYELGTRVARFRRAIDERLDRPDLLTWLQQNYPIDRQTAWNIEEYFRRQKTVTGLIPHDRLLLLEGFRDEIGDPRIVLHSAFGRRINGLLGLTLARRLHRRTGVEPQMLYNDGGVLLRCSDADVLPLDLLDGLTAGEAREIVLEDILTSPLFGGQFRQNAGRALLLPRAAPGKRTPLWLQRLRAKDLLELTRRYDDFPILVETMREVLTDILDFDHFLDLVRSIEQGDVEVHTLHTEVPSPFAASLLFDFIAVYMYEWDQPRADKLSQCLAVNRELLSEIVDLDTVSSMIRPEAIESVEHRLQHIADGTRARSPEELMEILVRLGDLTEEEIRMRCEGDGRLMLEELGRDGRAVPVRISTDVRWVAGEDASVYGDLSQDPHLRVALQRYLQSHGPVSTHQLAGRYGQDPQRIAAIASSLGSSGAFVRGRFRVPQEGSAGEEWCYRPNVGRLHRQTLTILRHEITPSSLPVFTRFLCAWQHATPRERLTGPSAVQDILAQFAGASLPAEIWDRDLLPSRIRTYTGSQLQQAAASGEIVWIGTGPGRMMPVLRGEGSTFLGASQEAPEQSEAARRILDYLRDSGASFLRDIRNATRIPLHTINHAMTELFWDGRITNDVFTEITAIPLRGTAMDAPLERLEPTIRLRTPGRSRILVSARRSIREVPGWSGRWSLTDHPGIRGEELGDDERVRHQVDQLLDRYGIVARELHRRENLLPWPILASELQHREMLGLIRRGYFVEGLAGMQYALPAAVEMLRSLQGKMADPDEVIVLNACDPANPYGSGVPLSASDSAGQTRLQRTPGTYLVIRNGVPRTLLENFGARAWSLGEPDGEAMKEGYRYIQRLMLPSSAGRKLRKAVVEYVDGERPAGTSVEALLRDLGFSRDMDQTMRFDG